MLHDSVDSANKEERQPATGVAMNKIEALRALDEIEDLTKYMSTVGGSKKKYLAQDGDVHTAFVVIRTYLQGLPDKNKDGNAAEKRVSGTLASFRSRFIAPFKSLGRHRARRASRRGSA
jgi:hypothetical protein